MKQEFFPSLFLSYQFHVINLSEKKAEKTFFKNKGIEVLVILCFPWKRVAQHPKRSLNYMDISSHFALEISR